MNLYEAIARILCGRFAGCQLEIPPLPPKGQTATRFGFCPSVEFQPSQYSVGEITMSLRGLFIGQRVIQQRRRQILWLLRVSDLCLRSPFA
ncbi:hypothetical protein [Myxosarcina sp. GI1(2024)]